MQSNKPSKKTRKPAASGAAEIQDSNIVGAQEVNVKPRSSKSSTSKQSETTETTAAKRHRKAVTPVQETPAAPFVPRAMAAAAGSAAVRVADPVTHVKARDVSYGEVAQLAYYYWEARGRRHGSPEEDWLRAEQELKVNP